jgi:hypothetical protein
VVRDDEATAVRRHEVDAHPRSVCVIGVLDEFADGRHPVTNELLPELANVPSIDREEQLAVCSIALPCTHNATLRRPGARNRCFR